MKTLAKKIASSACVAMLLIPHAAPVSVLAAEAARSSSLNGVEVGSDEVRLKLSEQVRFNVFVTADPARLVVELLGTEHPLPKQELLGRGKALKKVRTGQYQRDPSLITRIVLDMNQLTSYKASWEGRELVVRLMAGAGSETAVASASAAAGAPIEAPVPAPAKPAAAPVAALPPPAPAPVAPASQPAKPAAPQSASFRESEALPEKMTTQASMGLALIAREKDVTRAPAPAPAAAPAAVARPAEEGEEMAGAVGSRRDIMASLPGDPTSLDFDNTDIREILKLMATKARINIVYGSDVSGSMTLHVTDVPFNEAFTTILSMQGLVANQVGENILRVMTPANLSKERAVAVNQTRVIKLKYSKADDIKTPISAVRAAEGRVGQLVSDLTTNSLIVTDTLDGIAGVERLIAQLDQRPQQVMIEAKLVEVKLSKDVHFGIQWDYFEQDRGKALGKQGLTFVGAARDNSALTAIAAAPVALDTVSTPISAPTGAGGRGTGVSLPANKIFGAFTFGRVTNNYFLSATLTAAAGEGKVKVLSDPKIATINGKKASINISTQIPYVTSSVTATGVATQAVAYTQTGITLEVLPTINADGRVTLEISPTVSQPSSIAGGAGTTGAIGVDSRTAKTTVLVQDGETVVIGGLITDSVNNVMAKIPILGDIPFLGWFFKKKSVVRDRVELLIFVTPKVVPS